MSNDKAQMVIFRYNAAILKLKLIYGMNNSFLS